MNLKTSVIATHNGVFHADEVFAVATIKAAFPDLEITVNRSRIPEVLSAADFRIDVGGKNDPSTNDFDHHQRGGAGVRPNGVPYASFGLVWKEFGSFVTTNEDACNEIDKILVQPVDATDNGFNIYTQCMDDLHPYTVSAIISDMNPSWNEPQNFDETFEGAVTQAMNILENVVRRTEQEFAARDLVREYVKYTNTPTGIAFFPRFVPWQKTVVNEFPHVQFVVYPNATNTWNVQAVPKELGKFGNRADLPAEWAGKNDVELAQLTGVEDAIFCHNGQFICGTKTADGAKALARLALEIG